MMKNLLKLSLPGMLLLAYSIQIKAQTPKDSVPEKFIFTKVIDLPATSVKDQGATGTCWSFATTSFLESELLRTTKDTFDLSEMFFARKAYEAKAIHYVRLHGMASFGEGGQAHDVMNVIRKYGMYTEAAYSGIANGQIKPAHSEMEAVLEAIVGTISKNPGRKLSPEWMNTIPDVLDVYMGKVPSTMSKNMTPIEFAKKINPNDYVEITSFTHHPFYTQFVLEVPDNWSGDEYYNVPLDELVQIMDYALSKGYTVDWDADASDKGFSHKNGVAVEPEVTLKNMDGTERVKWDKLSEKELREQFYTFTKPVPERNITPEIRQAAFDDYATTDDHLMHITGTVKDQNGKRYFHTKNSWAADSNIYGGYLNVSEAYIRLNTIAIMVHKDAIPKDIRKKMGIL